jgi:hypothetical protein
VALLSLTDHIAHISQMVKQAHGRDLPTPLIVRLVNQVYMEIADVTSYHRVRLNFSLTAGKGVYTVAEIGTGIRAAFLRPLRVLYAGKELESADDQVLQDEGLLDPDLAAGTPRYYSWETGDLEFFPAPDAAAAAYQATLVYVAYPGDLTEDAADFHPKFRAQWDEAIDWGVIEKYVAVLPTEELAKVQLSLGFVSQKYAARLDRIRLDAAWNPTKKYEIKIDGGKKLAEQFETNYGY